MKKIFFAPSVHIVRFSQHDIIATSDPTVGTGGDLTDPDDEYIGDAPARGIFDARFNF